MGDISFYRSGWVNGWVFMGGRMVCVSVLLIVAKRSLFPCIETLHGCVLIMSHLFILGQVLVCIRSYSRFLQHYILFLVANIIYQVALFLDWVERGGPCLRFHSVALSCPRSRELVLRYRRTDGLTTKILLLLRTVQRMIPLSNILLPQDNTGASRQHSLLLTPAVPSTTVLNTGERLYSGASAHST